MDYSKFSIEKDWKKIENFFKEWKKRIGTRDFAAAIQLFFEEFFIDYIKAFKKEYNIKKIALAGGGFANVKLNLRIIEEKLFDEVYIFPAMGDDGTSLGAILYDDFLEGVILSLQKWNEDYDLSGEDEEKLIDVANEIISQTKSLSKIRFEPHEIEQPQKVKINISKIIGLGYRPQIKIKEGISKCLSKI